jgi:hypothetical protein
VSIIKEQGRKSNKKKICKLPLDRSGRINYTIVVELNMANFGRSAPAIQRRTYYGKTDRKKA